MNFSIVSLVFIFRCSSTTTNPVCERRVNLLVYSLSLHRHSYIGFTLAFASSIHNKQTTPVHLSSWNPSKSDILYTDLGILPTYRTRSSWKPPNQRTCRCDERLKAQAERSTRLAYHSSLACCASGNARCCGKDFFSVQ